MNDSELQQLWQQHPMAPPAVGDLELVRRMRKKMRKFDHQIFWRDLRELVAGVLLLFWFGPGIFSRGSALSRVGCGVIVASAIWIDGRLFYSQWLARRSRRTESVRGFFEAEFAKVSRQIMLLKSVLWWYILPIYIGAELDVFGGPASLAFKLWFTVLYGLMCGGIYWLNQYAVREGLAPLQRDAATVLAALSESNEPNSKSEPEHEK